ncbi:hypothetical protein Tco_0473650, partial [Tanacetum coccineum]
VVNTATSCTLFLLTGCYPSCWKMGVPAGLLVSAVGCLFLLTEYTHAAGVVYAVNTSIYTVELVCAG